MNVVIIVSQITTISLYLTCPFSSLTIPKDGSATTEVLIRGFNPSYGKTSLGAVVGRAAGGVNRDNYIVFSVTTSINVLTQWSDQ